MPSGQDRWRARWKRGEVTDSFLLHFLITFLPVAKWPDQLKVKAHYIKSRNQLATGGDSLSFAQWSKRRPGLPLGNNSPLCPLTEYLILTSVIHLPMSSTTLPICNASSKVGAKHKACTSITKLK